MRKGLRGFASIILLAALAAPGSTVFASAPDTGVAVPAPLVPWEAWVLKGDLTHACPVLTNLAQGEVPAFVCAWPGRLELDAGQKGATFSIRWRVDAPSFVPLLGGVEHWPTQVTVDGVAEPVVERAAMPSLYLGAGAYVIRGRIDWDRRPEELTVPASIGLLHLVVDGATITLPERDGDSLTLGRGAGAREAESLEIKVFRNLTDAVPAMLETRIELDASGPDREVALGPVLPAGFVPVDLKGDLAARLDTDGRLRLQLQSGEWDLTFTARATGPLTTVSSVFAAPPWPAQEVWSYTSQPRLRVSSAKGGAPIDPVQAGVPDDWAAAPAFVMGKGTTLSVEESSRGLSGTDRNRLTLVRDAWRDFDGGAYYFKDTISGSMKQGWRLDVPAPLTLEHAQEHSDRGDKPLLVTAGDQADETGIEVRNPAVGVAAGLRLAPGSAMPVTGWLEDFDTVTTRLHLPVGYLLFAAPGADTSLGSWLACWTLLDVFIVAVIAAFAFRLFGRKGGALALAFLVLAYPEPGVPLWSLAAVCIFALLGKALPAGRLQGVATTLTRLSLAVFLLMALPFLATQVRYAVYPQLQPSDEWGIRNVRHAGLSASRSTPPPMMAAMEIAPNAPPPPPLERSVAAEVPASAPASSANPAQLGKIEVTGTRIQTSDFMQRYAENTIVQAGEGEPDWEAASDYVLEWTGPVTPEDRVHLLILPPWATRLLRLLLVALLAGLALVLVRQSGAGVGPEGFDWRRWTRRTAAVAALLLPALLLPHPVRADAAFPPPAMLEELKVRLTAPPACADRCAAIARAEVHASGDEIDLLLEAHALARVAVAVPGSTDTLALTQVSLDGTPVDGVVARDKAVLVTLPRGVHGLLLKYLVQGAGKIPLTFPLKPARIEFAGADWQAEGINEHRLQTDTLNLVRLQAARRGSPNAATQQFPPFVTLRRTVSLNLDWEVENVVERVAPAQGGFTVTLPLLPGEHVLTQKFPVKDGMITVPLLNQYGVDWRSRFDRSASFTLTAPALADHAEEWDVIVSPMWHATFSGLPGVLPRNFENDDFWIYEFHPLPGEKLTVSVTRPATVPGPTLAIDEVRLATRAGQHAGDHDLTLSIRSTQAGDHVITLPVDADLRSVRKDGTAINVPLRDGRLVLPITAATQSFDITWRDTQGVGLLTRTPEVDVGTDAANDTLSLLVPPDRWVLLTYGPRMGPAVLYWGELIVMLLVAWALSHVEGTPLKFRHWVLLGIGFSTFSWTALLAVVLWLLALRWRAGYRPEASSRFKLVQLALATLTVIAVVSLASSIPLGLLGVPHMHIAGGATGGEGLTWFADRSGGALPTAWVLTLPLWCYKLAMLAWALWLAFALVEWLRWAFACWSAGGYWPAREASPPAEEAKR